MLQIKQLEELVGTLAADLKKHGGKIEKLTLCPVYAETVQLYNDVSIHADVRKVPKELIEKKAPNETQEELDYRVGNYQPITPPYWNKAAGTVNRIWNEQNYRVQFDDEVHHKYFKEEFPVYGSVEFFFQSVLMNEKLKDPNAVILVEPYEIPEREDGTIDQAVELEPITCIYNSDKVIKFKEGEYVLLLKNEKSMVRVGEKEVEEGLVFALVDDDNFYKVYQTGKKEEWNFQYEVRYQHALTYIPCWKLKGIPIYYDGELLYHSHFMSAVPLLNLAAFMHSTLDGIIAKHAYPIRAYYYEDCKNPHCESGWITTNTDGTPKKDKCPVCEGSGKSTTFSPFRDFGIKITEERMEGANPVQFPGVAYVEPGTEMFDWSYNTVIDYIERSFAFLNIDVSSSKPKGNEETALGKQIDREELMSFLILIAKEVFELLDEVIFAIGLMRYGKNFKEPKIIQPHEFSIKNSAALTEEYKMAQDSGLPTLVKTMIFNEYMAQRFANDDVSLRINKIVFRADPYMTLSSNEISSKVSSGLMTKWRAVLHDQIYVFIAEEIETNEAFLEKPDSEIVTILQGKAKTVAAELEQEAATTEGMMLKIPPIAKP